MGLSSTNSNNQMYIFNEETYAVNFSRRAGMSTIAKGLKG